MQLDHIFLLKPNEIKKKYIFKSFRFFEYEIIQRVFTTMSLNENNEEVKVNSTIFEPVATDLRKNHTYSKVRRCIFCNGHLPPIPCRNLYHRDKR